MRSAVNMWHYSRCFAQMLVMGFPLARLEKLPKTSEWQGLGRASLACSSTCLHSQYSEIPCLGPTRRNFVKIVFPQKMHIHCGLSFFCKNVTVLRNPVGEFVWPGWIFCSKSGKKTNPPTTTSDSVKVWEPTAIESPGQPALLKEV